MKVIGSWERHHLPFVTWKELRLLPNQKLKWFSITGSPVASLLSWVRGVFIPGESSHLMDVETGFYTPYTSAAGYELKFIKFWETADQPAMFRYYIDGMFLTTSFYHAGGVYSEQDIALPSTAMIDPLYASPHITDGIFHNAGLGDMRGTHDIIGILTDHRSDEAFEHKTKKVKCPVCNNIKTVEISATNITCDNGHNFKVSYHPWGGTQ